jgi:hypothetical protein
MSADRELCFIRTAHQEGNQRQFADRLEFLRHFHMLVFSPDTRSLVAGDRIGNSLGNIAGEKFRFQIVPE